MLLLTDNEDDKIELEEPILLEAADSETVAEEPALPGIAGPELGSREKLATIEGVVVNWAVLKDLELGITVDVLRVVDDRIKVNVLRTVKEGDAELGEPRTIDSGWGKKLELEMKLVKIGRMPNCLKFFWGIDRNLR